MSLTRWLCPCGTSRVTECAADVKSVPACPRCKLPMEREPQELIPGLAQGLKTLTPIPQID